MKRADYCSCLGAVALLTACGGGGDGEGVDAGADVAPPPALAGQVFEDLDGDGMHGADEPGVSDWTVYIDANDNGTRDDGEPTAVTDATGRYAFDTLAPGDHVVRQDMAFGWRSISGGEPPAVSALRSAPARGARDRRAPTSRIIGGTDVPLAHYPFMAGVGFFVAPGELVQFCGAALISDRHVITAAHCSEGAQIDEVGVIFGTANVEDGSGTLATVTDITLHPSFVDPTQGHDIALWELAEPVDLAAADAYTIDMLTPESEALAAAGALATTLGWGSSDRVSDVLQGVHVPVVTDADCAESYPGASNLETQICAGAAEGGIDACQGDSGGPLIVRDAAANRWYHAGITSWGDGCAVAGKPGVYARTAALSSWVMDLAREPSRVHQVTVTAAGGTEADFGNVRTTRPFEQALPPRWQLVSMSLPGELEPDVEQQVSWRILDEAGEARSFSCVFDADGSAPLLEPQAVDCAAGVNQVTVAGFAAGVYFPTLTVTAGEVALARRAFVVAGEPPSSDVAGELTAADPVDPDFDSTYYVDYYQLEDLSTDRAAIIAMDAAFSGYLVLYDADQRTTAGGGTLRAAFVAQGASLAEQLAFVPEPGKRYLVGVSTIGESVTGAYTVRAVNSGTLTPVTLPTEPGN